MILYIFGGYAVSVLVLWGYFSKELSEYEEGDDLPGQFVASLIWPLVLVLMLGAFIRTKKDVRALNRENLLKEAKQENALLENQIQALEAELKLKN